MTAPSMGPLVQARGVAIDSPMSRGSRWFAGMLMGLWCSAVVAADWSVWVERAWLRDPQAAGFAAGREAVRSEQSQAQRWFAGPADLELGWLDDRPLADRGRAERELALSVPLWQPGERAALRQRADLQAALLEVEAARHRLVLAQALIECGLRVDLARRQLRQRRAERELAATLASRTAAAVQAGEHAPLELNRAENERLRAEQSLQLARRALRDAESRWRQLTGAAAPRQLPALPRRVPLQDTLALQHAELGLALAEAQLQELDARRGESPRLGLHWGAEREAAGERWDDRVGIALELPLGTAPAQRRARTEAAGALAVAQRALAMARQDQAEARRLRAAERRDAERMWQQAGERVRWLQEALHWSEQAYVVGEIGLTELLTARREQQAALGEEIESRDAHRRAVFAEALARGWRP